MEEQKIYAVYKDGEITSTYLSLKSAKQIISNRITNEIKWCHYDLSKELKELKRIELRDKYEIKVFIDSGEVIK